jgi:hypothetical protein
MDFQSLCGQSCKIFFKKGACQKYVRVLPTAKLIDYLFTASGSNNVLMHVKWWNQEQDKCYEWCHFIHGHFSPIYINILPRSSTKRGSLNFGADANIILTWIMHNLGARGSVVDWGTMQKAGRSRVRVPMRSLDFSIDIILPTALWPWGRLSL